jgi:hypothetical protein
LIRSLVYVDLAAVIVTWIFQAGELIPASAWAQYPIVAIGAVLMIMLMRHWTHNEENWRRFTEEERARFDKYLDESLQKQRLQYLEIMREREDSHKKTLSAVSESQRAAYEEALERFLDATMNKSDKNWRNRS